MSDEFDEQVERLLPCFCYRHLEPFREHHETCPAYYRPAVAAALRGQGKQIPPQVDHWKRKADHFLERAEKAEHQIADLRADNGRLKHEWQQAKDAVAHLEQGKPLGELVGKQTIVNMGREIADLRAEVERLKHELLVIGDMAVVNWDDAVVGVVDKAVPEVPKTYAEARRAERAQIEALRVERDQLKAQLAAWQSVFQTSQLTHAQARLERAEEGVKRWLEANGPGGWIDELRNQRIGMEEKP